MTLIDELKERRDRKEEVLDEVAEAIKEREEYRLRVEQELDDLDLAIAALQPGEVMITVTNDEPETQTGEGVEIPPGFTKWEGGECPLPVGTRFDMICRACGPWHDMEVLADSSLEWQHTGRDLDVIAYRIIEASPTSEDQPDDASEFAESEVEAGGVVAQRECTCHPDDAPPVCQHRYAASLCQASYEAGASLGTLGSANFDDEAQRAAAIELTADVEPIPQPEWNAPQPTEGYAPVVDHTEAHIQAVEAERYALPTNPEADALAKAHDWYDPKAVHDRNRFNPWGIFKREKEDA
jgi:hypothetical protein